MKYAWSELEEALVFLGHKCQMDEEEQLRYQMKDLNSKLNLNWSFWHLDISLFTNWILLVNLFSKMNSKSKK